MSRKMLWGLMVSLGAILPATSAGAACDGKAVVLKPESGAPTADFKAWLEKKTQQPVEGNLYAVDVDNDGKNEFVLTRSEGSGGYLYMEIYQRSPDGSFIPHEPPRPKKDQDIDGPWYLFEYANPRTNERELFSRMCGKTYMSFMGGKGYGSRNTYLWTAKGMQSACDAAWTASVRSEFKKLYDAKAYDLADKALSGLFTQCGPALGTDTRAWVANDLAITQYKLGEPQRCLEYVQQAKESPKVLSAAQYNEKLCKSASDNRSTDFSWLLDKSMGDSNQISWAPAFQPTLHALVPNLKQGDPERLRKQVAEDLGGPPDPKQVDAGRYVTVSASMAHNATSKAMMWVDVQQHTGLVALNEASSTLEGDPCYFAVASRLVGPKELPAPFWEAFKRWRSEWDDAEAKKPGVCVSFVAADGTVSRMTPP